MVDKKSLRRKEGAILIGVQMASMGGWSMGRARWLKVYVWNGGKARRGVRKIPELILTVKGLKT